MKCHSLMHLTDHALLRDLAVLVSQDRVTTVALLAHLAEADERKLYLPAAYPSMYMYCVKELRMSEDMALKRIRAARTARQFPVIYDALADGRLNLSAVLMLTPHLTVSTAADLLTAAAHKANAEIEQLLAQRFPRQDTPTLVHAIASPAVTSELTGNPETTPVLQLAARPVAPSNEASFAVCVEPLSPRAKIAPLSPERFALQLTIGQSVHDKLRYAQELLGHTVPSGNIAEVLERALDALIARLEQRKFAATARSRPVSGQGRSSADSRYIPAEVRRSVWKRDGGQCTFVSESGRRCEARKCLEFDHIEEFASGGEASVTGLRLRCRAHNQYTAECTFGAEFMRGKRQEARDRATQARAKARTEPPTDPQDVTPWLRQLGFRSDEVRRGVEACAHIPDAPIEERVRTAVRVLAPRCVRRVPAVASSPA